MKRVTDTLGLIAERVKGVRPKRGPQTRDGDLELAADIRRLGSLGMLHISGEIHGRTMPRSLEN